jgi:glycosyltransferase involved in cell wall biosynthesis
MVNPSTDSSSFPPPSSSLSQPTIIEENNTCAATDSPLLAIIIPCWNYENYVGPAIRSVLSQEEAARCELVVIDDGSTDGSWEAIRHEGVKAYRISNSGARLACVFGLDRTIAPFVLFLDADDELAPGSLAKILPLLDPEVAKLQFALTRIDPDGNVISKAAPKLATFRSRLDVAEKVLRTGAYTSPPTSGNILRRDVCEHLRTAHYDNFVDGITLFVAPFMGDIISLSDELGRYRIHGRNQSGLGASLNPVQLHHDLRFFVERQRHLRQILETSRQSDSLVQTEHTPYFLERQLYLEIAEGRRIRIKHLRKLLGRLWPEPRTFQNKIALSVFLLCTAALPNQFAQRVVEYRLFSGHRRRRDILRAVFWEARSLSE